MADTVGFIVLVEPQHDKAAVDSSKVGINVVNIEENMSE
jgi:hypothetical protein